MRRQFLHPQMSSPGYLAKPAPLLPTLSLLETPKTSLTHPSTDLDDCVDALVQGKHLQRRKGSQIEVVQPRVLPQGKGGTVAR